MQERIVYLSVDGRKKRSAALEAAFRALERFSEENAKAARKKIRQDANLFKKPWKTA